MAEAAAQFQKGWTSWRCCRTTPNVSDRSSNFALPWARCCKPSKGNAAPETGDAFVRARQLWEQLRSPSGFLRIPYGQSFYHVFCGELDLALRFDEDLPRLSRQRYDFAGFVLGRVSRTHRLRVVQRQNGTLF